MTTEEKFRAAVNVIKNLPKNGSYQPSHDLMLRFYAFFKQATEGPCKSPRPAFWEVVRKMKWEAWNKLGNMSQEEAMNNYVEELKKIVETMSYTDNVASFLGSLGSFYDHVPVEDLELLVGPVIERIRSQPGSPLSTSPFGSRDTSPTRVQSIANGRPHITSSLETSPASSYSASPLPPGGEDDDDEEEFKDTVETAPERFTREIADTSLIQAPSPMKGYANGLSNGYGPASPPAKNMNGHIGNEENFITESTRPKNRSNFSVSPTTTTIVTPQDVDISEHVAAAVTRLQQDLQQIIGRLGSLERAMLARNSAAANAQKQQSQAVVQRYPRWWPFKDLSPRTFAVVTFWPLLLHLAILWLQRRRVSRPHYA